MNRRKIDIEIDSTAVVLIAFFAMMAAIAIFGGN